MAVTHGLRHAATLAAAFFGFAFGVATAGPVAVDTPAPVLDIRLIGGKLVKGQELRGKVVVTMVWATWSPAARMQLGELQRLYSSRRGKGLEVLALSIDESIGEVREYWRAHKYTMPVAMRSDAFFDHYGRVTTTPMYYIADRQGVLRHRIAGPVAPDELAALLNPLLAEARPSERVARH